MHLPRHPPRCVFTISRDPLFRENRRSKRTHSLPTPLPCAILIVCCARLARAEYAHRTHTQHTYAPPHTHTKKKSNTNQRYKEICTRKVRSTFPGTSPHAAPSYVVTRLLAAFSLAWHSSSLWHALCPLPGFPRKLVAVTAGPRDSLSLTLQKCSLENISSRQCTGAEMATTRETCLIAATASP